MNTTPTCIDCDEPTDGTDILCASCSFETVETAFDRPMRHLHSGTAAHTRASSLYALEVPCANGVRDNILDQLREACPTLVAASFPTPGGVTIGFRAPNDDEAILIATATLGSYAGTLHTGLGVNQRMVAVSN